MQREILFRGKSKATWKWVYGSYTHCHDVEGNPSIIPKGDNRFVSVIADTVGQYSNKLDSELTKVFDGDIVQGDNGKMWEVIYSIKASSWIISNKRIKDNGRNKFAGDEEYTFDHYRRLCKSAKTDTFKKIGNIWDNPELVNPAIGSDGINHMLDPNLKAEEQATQEAEGQINAAESAAQDAAVEATETVTTTESIEETGG